MRSFFYYEAIKITEMREKLLAVAFTFCETFKRGINRPNIDPQLFFFEFIFIIVQGFDNFRKKKNTSLLCKGVQGK